MTEIPNKVANIPNSYTPRYRAKRTDCIKATAT